MAIKFVLFIENYLLSVWKKDFLAVPRQMSGEPTQKKVRVTMKIGTHNGTFHCDEVLACCLLKQLPEYADAEIVRYGWF